MSIRPDFSKMKLSELIQFAEEQERVEREQGQEEDPERLRVGQTHSQRFVTCRIAVGLRIK